MYGCGYKWNGFTDCWVIECEKEFINCTILCHPMLMMEKCDDDDGDSDGVNGRKKLMG